MSVRQYIGARYVPTFGRVGEDSIQWDNTKPYEPLTIVLYQGNSYTSRQYVPVGIDITNETFWALTGNYNAQIEAYRAEVARFDERITANEDSIRAITDDDWVTSQRIADGAITNVKIADGAITNVKLADGAITNVKLADGAVTNAKLANDSVDTGNIVDGAILRKIRLNTNFLTPEMFGAIGGTADDTQAFQDMFDAATNGNICILTKSEYTIKNTVNIQNDFVSMIGLCIGEMNPKITVDHSDNNFIQGFLITATGVSFENIHFLNNARVNGTYILDWDIENIDSTINNCVFGQADNHIRVKGRNIKIHDTLFSSFNGNAITIADAQIANMRGYHIYNNRFHSGNTCVYTNDVTSYVAFFGLTMESNYIDGCNCIYNGISDGLAILNNTFHQHYLDSDYIIELQKSVNDSSHITTKISGNYVDDIGASTRLKGFLRMMVDTIHGAIEISNNFFDCQYTTDHAVMVIRGGNGAATRLVITNNFIRTANSATPIQTVSNFPTFLGLISGNYISYNGSTYYTTGSLTDGVNYHD